MNATMEDLLRRDQVDLDIEINDTFISCVYGELEYTIEGDCGIVNTISVYHRTREGI